MSDTTPQSTSSGGDASEPRRDVLARIPGFLAVGTLLASYGTLAAYCLRYLYPPHAPASGWMFVAQLKRFVQGETLLYKTPSGQSVNITRRGNTGGAEDFVALSSVCPHLGCQVHWEPQHDRYFCPCHNGIFDREGTGIGGPPGDAGQSLSKFPLKIASGLLFIEVRLEKLEIARTPEIPGPRGEVIELAALPRGPSHDPCLGGCGNEHKL